jgi:hypothetical protein
MCCAAGYFFVGPQITTDEKVSAMHDAMLARGDAVARPPASFGEPSPSSPYARKPPLKTEGSQNGSQNGVGASSVSDARFEKLACAVEAQEARLDKLTASVDALAAALHTNTKMLARIGAADRRQSGQLLQKRPPTRQQSASALEDVAPLSSVDRSRPQPRERSRAAAPAAAPAAAASDDAYAPQREPLGGSHTAEGAALNA